MSRNEVHLIFKTNTQWIKFRNPQTLFFLQLTNFTIPFINLVNFNNHFGTVTEQDPMGPSQDRLPTPPPNPPTMSSACPLSVEKL